MSTNVLSPSITTLSGVIDTERYALEDTVFRAHCHDILGRDGALVLPEFLRRDAVAAVRREGEENAYRAYFCARHHNVYLTEGDAIFDDEHPQNRQVVSSKGCITDDLVAENSPLRVIYDSIVFREFLCAVLGEQALYEYADPLSSINLHYASDGQELGWHFDNSAFAITLLIQAPESGGEFEYVKDMRDTTCGDMNFDGVREVLDGRIEPCRLEMEPGALVLFRGCNAIHRVAPSNGARQRMLVVLAYNAEPGISLSESARMTFYGRLG